MAIYNASSSTYLAVFTDANGRKFNQPILGNDTTPLMLARGIYQMELFQDNQQAVPPKTLDLNATPVDYEVIGNLNPDPIRVAQSLEATVTTAQSVGAPDESLNALREHAFLAYVVAKDDVRANVLAASLDKSGDPAWTAARALAAKPLDDIRASVSADDPVALAAVAQQLARWAN